MTNPRFIWMMLGFGLFGCRFDESCIETIATSTDRRLSHVWTDSAGSTLAFGPSVLSHRDADGHWRDESVPTGAYFGASTEEADWLFTNDGPMYRPHGGDWVTTDFEGRASGFWEGDLVRTVGIIQRPQTDRVSVRSWNGARWAELATTTLDTVSDTSFLPNGDAVIVGYRRLLVQTDGGFVEIETDDAARYSATAPDGTIVAFGNSIWVGTVDDMSPIDAPTEGWWTDAVALSATDIYFVGTFEYDPVIGHWDGSDFSIVHRAGQPIGALTARPDGSIIAVGGDRGRLVLHGDAAGFTAEVDSIGIPSPHTVSVDDTTGRAWAFGLHTAATGRSQFRGVDVPFVPGRFSDFVVSDGRVLQADYGRLVVSDNGRRAAFDTGGPSVICGVDGVFFAFSNHQFHRYTDAWESWELELGPDAEVLSCWADRTDSVYIGFSTEAGEVGGVAHYDGATTNIIVTGWERGPTWMRRQSDGELWVDGGRDGITRRWTGSAFERVQGLPAYTHEVYRRSDGSLFALHGEEFGTADRLSVRDEPDGLWELVFEVSGRLNMAGWGDDVWAVAANSGHPILWSNTCE